LIGGLVDELSVDALAVDELSVNELSVDELSVDESSRHREKRVFSSDPIRRPIDFCPKTAQLV
jgi:hypothetical protein